MKADGSGVSSANQFYTHKAVVTKENRGYNLRFTVTVKHGLVKFDPLSVSFGKIVHKHFYQEGGKDVWTYDVHFSSLKKLHGRSTGKLRLTVPMVNIHNQVFGIIFVWGVKLASKNSAAAKALAGSSDGGSDNTSSDSTSSTSGTSAASGASASEAPKSTSKSSDGHDNAGVTPKALAKYKVSPKKEKLADIALVNYPFIPVIICFLVVGGGVVAAAIYLRRRLLKGKNNVKK